MTEETTKRIGKSLTHRITTERKNNLNIPLNKINEDKENLFSNLTRRLHQNDGRVDSNDESVEESLGDISSRVLGILNLQDKYESYKRDIKQTIELESLQQKLVRYQNVSGLLIGITLSAVSFAWFCLHRK